MFKTLIDLCLILAGTATAFTGFLLLNARNQLCIVAFVAAALLAWLDFCWQKYEDDTH